ncbi:hypothetical protein D9M72_576940 [compost metagenome]
MLVECKLAIPRFCIVKDKHTLGPGHTQATLTIGVHSGSEEMAANAAREFEMHMGEITNLIDDCRALTANG